MRYQATIIDTFKNKKKINSSIINWINRIIKREQKNSLGISLVYVMVGSGVASLTAALSVNGTVSMPILITSACLAMGTNASVLSQQTFKTSSWFFIINITINTFLLIYQVIIL